MKEDENLINPKGNACACCSLSAIKIETEVETNAETEKHGV